MLDCQQTVVPPPANQSLPKLPPNEVLGFMSNRVQEQVSREYPRSSFLLVEIGPGETFGHIQMDGFKQWSTSTSVIPPISGKVFSSK